jgi:hypothetical protein
MGGDFALLTRLGAQADYVGAPSGPDRSISSLPQKAILRELLSLPSPRPPLMQPVGLPRHSYSRSSRCCSRRMHLFACCICAAALSAVPAADVVARLAAERLLATSNRVWFAIEPECCGFTDRFRLCIVCHISIYRRLTGATRVQR